MSSITPFSKVLIAEQFRTHKRDTLTYKVNGLDTETDGYINDGYARIIANQNRWVYLSSIDDVLTFLKSKEHQNHFNFFYNLRYDFEVLFNHDKSVFELFFENPNDITIEYTRKGTKYLITYIPTKLLVISWGHKSVKFYDIAQFFKKPLGVASKQYLNIEPHELKGERSDLFRNYPISKIAEYCKHDSLLTKLLSEWYLKQLHKLEFYPHSLISPGNLSAQYLLKNSDIPIIDHVPPEVLRLYYYSFKGGWFDLYKRGTIKTHKYDINSAYPHAFYDFPDIRDGIWVNEIDERNPLGVVECTLHDSPKHLLPIGLPTPNGGRIYNTIDTPTTAYLTKLEFLSLEKDYKIEPINFYSFRETPLARRPYKRVIDHLYKMKSDNKHDPGVYQSTKEIINSIYGKTVEKRKKEDSLITGNLWNPVYGSECTARCRMQIYNTFRPYRKDIVSLATDGVALTRKPSKIALSKLLGEWDYEGYSNTTYLMSGIFCDEHGKVKSRGLKKINKGTKITDFTRGKIETENLLHALDTPDHEIEIEIVRPTHFKEALIQGRPQDIGKFQNHPRTVTAKGDLKRLWINEPKSLRDLLHNSYNSQPVPVSLGG